MARRLARLLLALMATQLLSGCFFHGRMGARRQACGRPTMASPITIAPAYSSPQVMVGSPLGHASFGSAGGGAGCESCSSGSSSMTSQMQAMPLMSGMPTTGFGGYPTGPVMSSPTMPPIPQGGYEVMPAPVPGKEAPAKMPLSFTPSATPLLLKPASR